MASFGARLKDLRSAAKLKQETLAIDVGITQGALSKIENGNSQPSPDLVNKLAERLGVSLFALVGGTELAHYDPGGTLVKVEGQDGVAWLAYFASGLTALGKNEREDLFREAQVVRDVCQEMGTFLYQPVDYTDPVNNPDISAVKVYSVDRNQVAQSDILILYCRFASFGAGQEIEIATAAGIPIILLIPESIKVSRMVLGCYARTLEVRYSTENDLRVQVRAALSGALNDTVYLEKLEDSGLGKRIKALRKMKSLSLETISRCVGISPKALEELEEGDCTRENPSLKILRRLATLLDTSLSHMVDGVNLDLEGNDPILRNSKGTLEKLALRRGLSYEVTSNLWKKFVSNHRDQRHIVSENRLAEMSIADWEEFLEGGRPTQQSLYGDDDE